MTSQRFLHCDQCRSDAVQAEPAWQNGSLTIRTEGFPRKVRARELPISDGRSIASAAVFLGLPVQKRRRASGGARRGGVRRMAASVGWSGGVQGSGEGEGTVSGSSYLRATRRGGRHAVNVLAALSAESQTIAADTASGRAARRYECWVAAPLVGEAGEQGTWGQTSCSASVLLSTAPRATARRPWSPGLMFGVEGGVQELNPFCCAHACLVHRASATATSPWVIFAADLLARSSRSCRSCASLVLTG